jgi:oligosaccharyltransferase complex subunit beta
MTLRLPDNFGIYKWVIDYHRQGYSHVFVNETISVRPYRHDEYERFLFVAYPYYITAFSLIAAFVLFGIIFMHSPMAQTTVTTSTTAEKLKHG